VIRKGDPDRGALLLLVTSRGRHIACLERVLDLNAGYRWNVVGPADSAGSDEVNRFVAGRERFDDDLWAIEVDIAAPERFIAETTASG
jgi:hypothetical protein